MPPITPPPSDRNTPEPLTEIPMAFSWHACPVHFALAISVIVTADAAPWCVGDGQRVAGHWVAGDQVAA